MKRIIQQFYQIKRFASCRFLFSTFYIFHFSFVFSQSPGILYGLSYGGVGINGLGSLYAYDPLTYKDTVLVSFNGSNGKQPYGNLIQYRPNGMLYGMTPYDGTYSNGVIFRYNTYTGTDSVVYNFLGGSDGSTPYGSLLELPNGLLYGLTSYGGIHGAGVLFNFNPATSADSILINFQYRATGGNPLGNVILATNGLLYGLTNNGRTGTFGEMFSYDIATGQDSILVTFNDTNGNSPRGSLIQADNGLLYGVTEYGGRYGFGTLFSYSIDSGGFKLLVSFNYYDGQIPPESIMQASDGNLYGVANKGGSSNEGVLFCYNLTTDSLTVKVNFTGPNGAYPWGDLIQASDGLLYGCTNWGGVKNQGIIFSYNIITDSLMVLHSFNDTIEAAYPYGDLLEAMNVIVKTHNNTCPNDSIGAIKINTRGAMLPLTYLWYNGNTTDSISNLKGGVYTCKVTDARGITFTISDTIKPTPTLITFNVTNPCSSAGWGSANAIISGGTAPFNYLWSNGATADTLTGLTVGIYTCKVTDANNCNAVASVAITPASPIVVDSVISTPASCINCADGTIKLYVSGGIPPGDSVYYIYVWTYGGSGDSVYGLPPGVDSVCITSPYGCGSICDSVFVVTGTAALKVESEELKIMPNPNDGAFNIVVSGQWSVVRDARIEIYNVWGQLVYSNYQIIKSSNYQIDLSAEPGGVYLYRVVTESGELSAEGKIVIIRN